MIKKREIGESKAQKWHIRMTKEIKFGEKWNYQKKVSNIYNSGLKNNIKKIKGKNEGKIKKRMKWKNENRFACKTEMLKEKTKERKFRRKN